jgi:hypothetical protein
MRTCTGRLMAAMAIAASAFVVVSTPQDAAAQVVAAPSGRFVATTPVRTLDTREGLGAPLQPVAGVQITGRTGVPTAGVIGVALNVTATRPSAFTFVTAWPQGDPQPTASSLNLAPGQTAANLVMAKLGPTGAISLFNAAGTVHLVADVLGYFTTGAGSGLVSLPPYRLSDTRESDGFELGNVILATFRGGQPKEFSFGGAFKAPELDGLPSTGLDAVVANITVTNTTADGFLSAWPGGEPQPLSSLLNWRRGETVQNLALLKPSYLRNGFSLGIGVSDATVKFFVNAGSADVIIDVVGYFAIGNVGPPMVPLAPSRLLDTREGNGAPIGPVGANGQIDVQVTGRGGVPASGVGTVLLNLTGTGTTAQTFLTLWPTGRARPDTSNVNLKPNDTRPNLVVAKVGADGKVSIYNLAGETQVVADVVGYTLAGQPGTNVWGGNNQLRVGVDIPPGRYYVRTIGSCDWDRVTSFSTDWISGPRSSIGSSIRQGDIGPFIIDILPTDFGLETRFCGPLSDNAATLTASPTGPIPNGTYRVGIDVAPGVYVTAGQDPTTQTPCAASVGRDFLGAPGTVRRQSQQITIASTDVAFFSEGCQPWVKVA